MKKSNETQFIIALVMIAILLVGGYISFLKGRDSVDIEGIRTATFCSIDPDTRQTTYLSIDMRNMPGYTRYCTFAFYNTDEASHIDVYGKVEAITPYCASVYDQNDNRYGFLTVVNDSAVLATESGKIYELDFLHVGTYADSNLSGWSDAYPLD